MNILYLTLSAINVNLLPNSQIADYQSDCLLHGLRSLYGAKCVDYPKKKHLYKEFSAKSASEMWGKGFTYSRLLDDIDVDRTDIYDKMYTSDIIILSVHWTIHETPLPLYELLSKLSNDSRAKLVVVDGHDTQSTYEHALSYTNLLFKREIPPGRTNLLPIDFGIPLEKIRVDVAEKNRWVSSLWPANHDHINRRTHIYDSEEEYYRDYAKCYFAITTKKAGWSCMRHFEVMANSAVPIFGDIINCPQNTLVDLPKDFLLEVNNIKGLHIRKWPFDKNDIDDNLITVDDSIDTGLLTKYCQFALDYTRNNLTTIHMATKLLERVLS